MNTTNHPSQGGSYVVDPKTGERTRVAYTEEQPYPGQAAETPEEAEEAAPAKTKKGA